MDNYHKISQALEYINAHMHDQPDLEMIAQHVNLSPFHFQRIFTEWAGVSPKKFLGYLSLEYAKEILKRNNTSVFDAAYETGLSGTGRLHDLFVNIEGMTPGEFKNGGKNLQIQYSFQESQFGKYLVASTSVGVCNVLFYEESEQAVKEELESLWPNAKLEKEASDKHVLIQSFFNKDFSQDKKIKLHLKGTDFQIKVWEALLRIPEGHLQSYSDVAQYIQQPTAQRAVGTAIGSNPVGFIIPCHRVIKSIGAISEYRWGVPRKMAMIGWEAAKQSS